MTISERTSTRLLAFRTAGVTMWRGESRVSSRIAFACGLLALTSIFAGCGGEDTDTAQAPRGTDVSEDECAEDTECEKGFLCIQGSCTAEGEAQEGEECRVTGECAEGLYCEAGAGERTGRCQPAGEGEAGDTCGSTSDCKPGLVCKAEGLSGVCTEAGEGGVGDPCEDKTDCRAGLNCSARGGSSEEGRTCSAGGIGRPRLYEGVDCAEDSEGAPRPYFEVPKSPEEVTEFYRLPFPNDIRISNGSPDLSGHPTPGEQPLGFDIVQTYIDQISSEQRGYGLQQSIYFRFSETIDFGTVTAGDDPTLRFLNITQGSDRYDRQPGAFSWRYTSGRTKYICPDWLGVRSKLSQPLSPDTTYAVILSKGIQTQDGEELEADEDFKKMLADEKPDGALGEAWESYQPLRDWVADRENISADDLIGAAVFTTGSPREQVWKLREPARAQSVDASDLTLCEEGTDSPCDDGLEGEAHRRGCFGENDSFHEIQGKLSLPIFQNGEAPYLEQGGGVEFKDGKGVVQEKKQVCSTMTIPKGREMPDNGWPLVLYAPGTGGTARDVVRDLAGSFSELGEGDNAAGVMMMSWEQVQHFRRRGSSDANPERLVFNYSNPDAAKGNFLQGAADIFAVVEWAEEFSLDGSESPTGNAVKIDPDRIYFVGHSQGGTTGPLALPYEPGIQGAILSGSGGGLTHSLLGKRSPRNVTAGVRVALHERELSKWHPVLSLLQGYFGPVDPLTYGKFVVRRQIEMKTSPRHVFHVYGAGDTYTPPKAIEALSRSLGIDYIEPVDFESGDISTTELPVSGNISTGEMSYTGIGRQYEPADYDGHFVLFRNEDARDDVGEFLKTGLLDGTPKIED